MKKNIEGELHHVAFLVYDTSNFINLFEMIGWKKIHSAVNLAQGVSTTFMQNKNQRIEFIEVIDNDALKKQLRTRGNHIHHVAFQTDNITEAINKFMSLGYKFINETPCLGFKDKKIVFFDMLSTKGILIELMSK